MVRKRNPRRDHGMIARGSAPASDRSSLTVFAPRPLLIPEDRRVYHPEGRFRPALASFRPAARIVAVDPVRKNRIVPKQTKATLAFADPGKVFVCVRRKVRREVLFASGRGAAPKPKRPPRRNPQSQISCR